MDIARGMTCLHAQRPIIIHRDLKPANLLVSARFEVKGARAASQAPPAASQAPPPLLGPACCSASSVCHSFDQHPAPPLLSAPGLGAEPKHRMLEPMFNPPPPPPLPYPPLPSPPSRSGRLWAVAHQGRSPPAEQPGGAGGHHRVLRTRGGWGQLWAVLARECLLHPQGRVARPRTPASILPTPLRLPGAQVLRGEPYTEQCDVYAFGGCRQGPAGD